MAGFQRESLTEALANRTVVQATLMRVTIHLVSARDHPLISAAVREARRAGYLKVFKQDPRAVERAALRVRDLLAEGPRTRDELQAAIGVDNQVWYGVGLWVDLVRVPPSGTWERRKADLFATAEAWLGTPASEASPQDGMKLIVNRYLGGVGPARLKDIATWAGVPLPAIKAALQGMQLESFRDEAGGELFDLPGAPLPGADVPAPVRFLPTWDATLLVHARRTAVLAEEHRPLVFNPRTPHSVPTFTVDGRVAGTWRFSHERVVIDPFAPLTAGVRREVEAEAERLSAFHA
jgi:hypothetical protein